MKFKQYYQSGIELTPDFFSAQALTRLYPEIQAKIVTSIAMSGLGETGRVRPRYRFDPSSRGRLAFRAELHATMLRMNSYDTVCHEHLEYYSLSVVNRLLDECGLRILDVEINAINGGSFAVTAAHKGSRHSRNRAVIDWVLAQENRMGLHNPRPYRLFEERVYEHRKNLIELIQRLKADDQKMMAVFSTRSDDLRRYAVRDRAEETGGWGVSLTLALGSAMDCNHFHEQRYSSLLDAG